MSAPIYFLPDLELHHLLRGRRFAPEILRERGLTHVLGDVADAGDECGLFDLRANGPGRKSGVVVCVIGNHRQPPARLGYYPEQQEWIEEPAGLGGWIGLDRTAPPTPADLLRRVNHAGHNVRLADGQDWTVPIVRAPYPPSEHDRQALGRSSLPMDFCYDKLGRLERRRRADHERLWELSGQVWDHLVDRENHPALPEETLLDAAIAGLALNYRVGKPEQTVLRLLDTTNLEPVLLALIDWPLIEQHLASQKKTGDPPTAATEPLSPGAADSIPVTGPAVAS